MATYEPIITRTSEGDEQRFEANLIHLEDTGDGFVIALEEILPRPGHELAVGTPIHFVLMQFSLKEPEFDSIEFNGQGNQRQWSNHVARLELGADFLRIVYVTGKGPISGRVSLAPSIEIFNDAYKPALLQVVRIGLGLVANRVHELRDALRTIGPAREKLAEIG